MKKILKIGAISLALSALPVMGAFADLSQTDNISITVSDNCALAYGSTAHANGDGNWTSNKLSATRTNGTVTYNLGKTNFNVICNNNSGYKVVVATSDLTHTTNSSLKIPAYSTTDYSASVSGWSPIIDSGSAPTASSTKYKSGDVVKTQSSATASTAFGVYYGVGISAAQPAGTYEGTAIYTLSKL